MGNLNNEVDLSKELSKEFEKIKQNIKRPNILVCGGTGSGKSSLINMALKDAKNKAETGSGMPVTQEIKKYQGDLVVVYDSPGYESGDDAQERYQKIVLDRVKMGKGASEQIHLVWYCISQGNDRILDIDVKTLIDIKNQTVPVAIILTQADKGTEESAKSLKDELAKSCPGIDIFETSNDQSMEMGVDPLVGWSIENLDESLRAAFVANTTSIHHKFSEGKKVVLHHIAAAATIAVSPIPFSDAALLTANQAALIARLAHLWNFSSAQKSLIVGALPGVLVSNIGKTLAGNLAKMVPGWGTAAGAVINIAVASSITAGIGYALNSMFEKMAKDEFAGKSIELSDYLKDLPGLVEVFRQSFKANKA